GEYTDPIAPEASGAEGAPITYRATQWREAKLVIPDATAIRLDDQSYIGVEDFAIDCEGSGRWVYATDCDHITVRGCHMRNARSTMQIVKSEQVRLLDNIFSKDRVTGNMISIRQCSFVLVEGNSLTRVGHSPMQITTCRNVVVRGNCFRNNWGRNYEFWATGRILIEDNVVTQARDSGYSADSRAKNLYTDGIFRHNRVFENFHTPLNSGSYFPMGANPTKYFREPFRLLNTRIYHNTITGNLGHGWEIYGMNISSNVFANNCFYRNDWTGGNVQFLVGSELSDDNRIRHNLFSGTDPGQTTIKYEGKYWTTQQANENTPVLRGFWSEFEDNIDADPRYVDEANNDFRLAEDSPCIDTGTPLTLAIGSGSGTALPVADGRYFFDGFGIEGEEGDWIAVGDGDTIAQIQSIELRYYQADILHLDREVAWEDGTSVSLPWTGEAPDIGAYEYACDSPARIMTKATPAYPEPGEEVSFSIDPMGSEIASVMWDFGDDSRSTDRNPSHTYEQEGDYAVICRAEFTDGRAGIASGFVRVRTPKDPDAPLVNADFEDATRETQWGYHFKYYRSWLTGYEHVQKPGGEGKCMRLYYDADKRNSAAGAVAPGVWDIDKYPYLQLDYRIPEGVPVAIRVEPFDAENMPRGFLLGGTQNRNTGGFIDLGGEKLIDDGQWHSICVDVRDVREEVPDLQYLYRAMMHCSWDKLEGAEFWYDNFAITTHPDA
ncbi:MAG: right-handed parallel beta-helix repeat-containing protein, partial [Armatimonadota bacterium]